MKLPSSIFGFLVSLGFLFNCIGIQAQGTDLSFDNEIETWKKCIFPDRSLYVSSPDGVPAPALQKCRAIDDSDSKQNRVDEEIFLSKLCRTIYFVSNLICRNSNYSQKSDFSKETLENYLDYTYVDVCVYGSILNTKTKRNSLLEYFVQGCDNFCKDDVQPLCRIMVSSLCQYGRLYSSNDDICNVPSAHPLTGSEMAATTVPGPGGSVDHIVEESENDNSNNLPPPPPPPPAVPTNVTEAIHSDSDSGVPPQNQPKTEATTPAEHAPKTPNPTSGVDSPGPGGPPDASRSNTETIVSDDKKPKVTTEGKEAHVPDSNQKLQTGPAVTVNPGATQTADDSGSPPQDNIIKSGDGQPAIASGSPAVDKVSPVVTGTPQDQTNTAKPKSTQGPKVQPGDAQATVDPGLLQGSKVQSGDTQSAVNSGSPPQDQTNTAKSGLSPDPKNLPGVTQTVVDHAVTVSTTLSADYPSSTLPGQQDDGHNNIDVAEHSPDTNYDFKGNQQSNDAVDSKHDNGVNPGDFQTIEENVPGSGHFFAYFLTAVVICISGYVIFHNKQKIMAFIVEGRNGGEGGRRRGSGNVQYSKLKSNVEEVMPSLDKATTAKNFVY